MLSSYTVEKWDNSNAVVNTLKLAYTQKNSNVFAYMLQLIYNIYTYIAKTRLSFCAHTDRCDIVNRLIFAFSDRFTRSTNTYRAVTTLYSHVELIYNIHTYTAKAWFSFCTHTDRCDAVNRSIFRIFKSIYMQRNHIQSSNSALFTRWAHIQHTHIYCEGTIQLLHTYTSVQRSKLIDFDFLIDLHALQIHTLWKHDTVFAYIHRTTATSLRTRCNSYTSHTHTLQRHDSAFAHLHACMMQ